MYHLTTAQHGILRTTAHNLCMTAKDKDLSDNHYQMYLLADKIAILTGDLPEDTVCHKAAEKAKALGIGKRFNECMKNAHTVLEVFLGSFTVKKREVPQENQETISRPLIDGLKSNSKEVTG